MSKLSKPQTSFHSQHSAKNLPCPWAPESLDLCLASQEEPSEEPSAAFKAWHMCYKVAYRSTQSTLLTLLSLCSSRSLHL